MLERGKTVSARTADGAGYIHGEGEEDPPIPSSAENNKSADAASLLNVLKSGTATKLLRRVFVSIAVCGSSVELPTITHSVSVLGFSYFIRFVGLKMLHARLQSLRASPPPHRERTPTQWYTNYGRHPPLSSAPFRSVAPLKSPHFSSLFNFPISPAAASATFSLSTLRIYFWHLVVSLLLVDYWSSPFPASTSVHPLAPPHSPKGNSRREGSASHSMQTHLLW